MFRRAAVGSFRFAARCPCVLVRRHGRGGKYKAETTARGTPPAPFSAARAGHRRRTAHASREPGTPSPRDRLSVVAPPTSPARYNGIQTSTIAHVESLPHASAWGLLLCAGSKQAPARTRMAVLCSPKRPASRGPTHTPSRTRALTSHMPAGRSPAPSAWLPHRKRP